MIEEFDTSGLDAIDIPHDFVIELNHLVTTNHRLVLQAIDADEDAELAKDYSVEPDDDGEAERAMENDIQRFYDSLRRAANNLATTPCDSASPLVNRMASKIKVKPNRGLMEAFGVLTARLGNGPVLVNELRSS